MWLEVPLLAVLSLVGACTDPIDWRVRFEDPSLRERAHHVEVTVRRGDCPGRSQVYEGRIGDGMRTPTLEQGPYAFSAQAIDEECVIYASGCTSVIIPENNGDQIVTLLRLRGPESACIRCYGGECTPPEDAGSVDAGMSDGGS